MPDRVCGNLSGGFDAALDMSVLNPLERDQEKDFKTMRARVPLVSSVDIALNMIKYYSKVQCYSRQAPLLSVLAREEHSPSQRDAPASARRAVCTLGSRCDEQFEAGLHRTLGNG